MTDCPRCPSTAGHLLLHVPAKFRCSTLLVPPVHAVLQERDAFLSLYPQGYHKTDKMVSRE